MTSLRKPPTKLNRVTLSGLVGAELSSVVESSLNEILDYLRIRTIALPSETRSLTPHDGELLFDGTSLFLVQGGVYNQVWPSAGGGQEILQEGEVSTDWPTRSSCSYTTVGFTSASTAPIQLVSSSPGSYTRLGYVHINNAANGNRLVGLQWGSGASSFFPALVPGNGGTIVQNLIGIENAATAQGRSLWVTFNTTGVGLTYITVGYYYL